MVTKSATMIIKELMHLQICESNITLELVVINDEHLQLLEELETSTMPETIQQEVMV